MGSLVDFTGDLSIHELRLNNDLSSIQICASKKSETGLIQIMMVFCADQVPRLMI